ncbi:hypothetical protein [Brasilonema sp. UFV-L1]|uniref:hypothetical protein n=1 Tax=Brasilonema sp. UFV-L1 TaxID=2234130 RepID=UPI00145F4BED|nr:hypothetical protein [Brasilonema sp. UFV-L1]
MARKYIRWSAEKVASYAMQDGYTINPLYAFVSVHELIPMTCPYGHNIEMRWKNFINGRRCGVCWGRYAWNTQRVRDYLALEGYTLKPGYEYKANRFKMPVTCPVEHEIEITLNNFQHGKRCGVCYYGDFFAEGVSISESYALKRILDRISVTLQVQGGKLNYKQAASIMYDVLPKETLAIYSKTYKGGHIDHIVPVSWFDLMKIDEVVLCFSPHNLRVIPALENLKKKDKLDFLSLNQNLAHILLGASRKPRIYCLGGVS